MIMVVINDSTASARRSQIMALVVRPAQGCRVHCIVERAESPGISIIFCNLFFCFRVVVSSPTVHKHNSKSHLPRLNV